jgi:hypothetical protein
MGERGTRRAVAWQISTSIGYAYDDLDEAALTGALDGTNDETADGWFDYPLAGTPPLLILLAQSSGNAVVSVHVEGTMDLVLATRIETLLDLLKRLAEQKAVRIRICRR